VGTKGMYEVTSGAALLYAEPDASGTPLCAIKGGVRFHGVPYTFGKSCITSKTWLMLHTDDVPPPLLCFGKEAGSNERRGHTAKQGIDEMSFRIGNAVVPRALIPRNMKDIQLVDTDKQFMCSGSVTSVSFFVGYPNIQHDLRFQVYRRVRGDIFRLVEESPAIACPESGVQTYVMPTPLSVARDDYVGWSHLGSGMISFDSGGNNMRWNTGRQGKDVNIEMKNGGSFTFSYEVTFKNHCTGHMLYKASAPAPLFHSPEISAAETLWLRLDEKCIIRIRDLARYKQSERRADDDNLAATTSIEFPKSSHSRSQMLPAISPEASRMSLTQSMSALDSPMSEWSKKGNGCWTNFTKYGPCHAPANDNCGRWRQLNTMK